MDRATLCVAASSATVGIGSPIGITPTSISLRSWAAIFSYGLRGSAIGVPAAVAPDSGRTGMRLNNEVDARWSDSDTHAA